MGQFFNQNSLGIGGHGFLGIKPVVASSTLILAFTLGQFIDNAGYDPTVPIGSINPANGTLKNNDNNPVIQLEYSNGTGLATLAVQFNVTQNYFTSITFGAPISITLNSASATFFGNTWEWPVASWLPFVGSTVSITIV